jgi:hypothetical protein
MNHSVERVVSDLSKKGCQISGFDVDIEVPFTHGRIGNKTWGKIDFLVRNKFRITGFTGTSTGRDKGSYLPIFEKRIKVTAE